MNVKGINGWTLLYNQCRKCDELNVLGFWQQLDTEIDMARKRVTVRSQCKKCGKPARRILQLTTGRPFRRRCSLGCAGPCTFLPGTSHYGDGR